MPRKCGSSGAIVRSARPVTVVGGAAFDARDLADAMAVAPRLVAADSGAAAAIALGKWPEAVIGDMDSLDPTLRARLGGRVHAVAEQETTDFEKVLMRIEAPLLIGVGFLGGRLDHQLAALSVVAREQRPCLLLGPSDVAFAAPRRLRLDLRPATRVSLFPLANVAGTSAGLRWPIAGIQFAPDGRIGTSNEALGPVEMEFDGPGMIVTLPRDCLAAALAAMSDAIVHGDRTRQSRSIGRRPGGGDGE